MAKNSPAFFRREDDGSVRLRIRFDAEEASLYEEAAGTTPVVDWLHATLGAAAREQVDKARRESQPKVAPRNA